MPEYSFTDEPIAGPAGVSKTGQGGIDFYSAIPGLVDMGAQLAAKAALGSPVGWGVKAALAAARADPGRPGWLDRLYNREVRDPYRKYIRDPLRALGILSTPQAEAAFGGYGTPEAETEGVAGIDTSGKTAYGGGETSHGPASWEKNPNQYTVTYDSDAVDAAEAAAAAAAAASLDFDEDYGWGEDIDSDDIGMNRGGFVTDNRQMPSGFRPLGYANGGSMGFRPIGVWSNGGLVAPASVPAVGPRPPEDLITGRGDYNEVTGSIEPYPTAFDPARGFSDTAQPTINIQSVANIPIQSAANVPLAYYQPSTPYVYPDPPATRTPATTPTGTENTFFAADPDKYTVPTPYGYGTTTPPPTDPTDPPPTDPDQWTWTPSPGWIKRPDGNIYLDKTTAPSRYFSQDDDGEAVFNQQKFLQDAYSGQLFKGSPDHRIDEIIEEDDQGDMHSYFRFVRAGGPNWNDGGFVQRSGVPYTQGGNAMPNVMGREFPYTPEGMAAAQQYRQAIGMRDGGMMGFRPIGMQTGGAADSGRAPEVMAIFQGLVDVTQSGSTQDVAAYIEANRQGLNDIASILPPGQASFVQNTLDSFAQAPEPDLNEMLEQFDKDADEYDRLSKDPGFAMAEEERMAGGPRQRSFGSSAAPDQLLMPGMEWEQEGIPGFKPPWMSDPRYKGYFNPDQLNPFFNPDDIEVANGGYITRNMNRGGLMSLRRR